MKSFHNYIIFWFGQVLSQLGSSMTSFALTIWVYSQSGSAMSVSLLTFCTYLPYVFVSLVSGTIVDKYSKKSIVIISDLISAICTLSVVIALLFGELSVVQIYIVNILIGATNALQSPASSVLTGLLVTTKKFDKVSGLNSLSNNLIAVVSPIFAGIIMSFAGLKMILLVDIVSFLFATASLLIVKFEEPRRNVSQQTKKYMGDMLEAWSFLAQNKGILYIMFSMALINFFSRLTYFNILSPMILSRSNGDINAYGIVSGVLGFGGIVGGIVVTARKNTNPIKMIYISTFLSFLFGDIIMGISRTTLGWCIGGIFASFPIPFITAGVNILMYEHIPTHIQGRVFAIRNAVQYALISIGIICGGYLADYVFEPFMRSNHTSAHMLQYIVGKGNGSGMAVMFLITGLLGAIFAIIAYKNKQIQKL